MSFFTMRFFTPTESFTHHASLWGIPCYVAFDQGPDGCTLAGTNAAFDWLILNLVPACFTLTDAIAALADPFHQTPGWPILVKGPIAR